MPAFLVSGPERLDRGLGRTLKIVSASLETCSTDLGRDTPQVVAGECSPLSLPPDVIQLVLIDIPKTKAP